MRHTAAIACGIGLFAVIVVMIALSPDAAFWMYFALLAVTAPVIVVVGAVRWIVKQCKGGCRAISK